MDRNALWIHALAPIPVGEPVSTSPEYALIAPKVHFRSCQAVVTQLTMAPSG
jgi:hypothetical protein